jgi:sugar phosphate isomerase/epimerase
MIRYSMMTYTLMRQKCFTPADCVRIAAELDMAGIDWVTTYGQDPEFLRKMSCDAGLTVAAHTFFLRPKEGETFRSAAERSLDDACVLGAPVVMIPPAPFSGVESREENRKRWCGILAEIADAAKSRGLTLTVENFPGLSSPFVTAADFYEAKKQVPSLKLTFDNGNAATGEDPLVSLKTCMKDIAHVHLKDWERSTTPAEGMRQMLDGAYYRPALIGEGVVDSRATVRELERSGYTGFVNIEYESSKYPGDEAVKKVLEFLRQE